MLNMFQAILLFIIRNFLTVITASVTFVVASRCHDWVETGSTTNVTEAVITVKKLLMMSDIIARNMLGS
jgi:hypothetical protein